MRRSLAIAVAFHAVSAYRFSKRTCGHKGGSSRIVNGDDAIECAWKWQVGLKEYEHSDLPFCGGMLVSEEWVLTAAHCMPPSTYGSLFYVIAGEHDVRVNSGKEQVVQAARLYPHPSYDQYNMDYDYALVKLSQPMEMTSCVGTICLPEEGDVTTDSECWITGWGTLSSAGKQPNILQEAQVGIISNTDCYEKNDYESYQISDRMICAQGRMSNGTIVDACQGDSGGPLACRSGDTWTIYGATSWGIGCAGRTYPGIWSRVHSVMPWINEVMSSGTATTAEPTTPTNPSPTPTDPTPTDPTPTDPTPTDPAPTDPAPTDPAPTDPAPTDPAPTYPSPNPPAEPTGCPSFAEGPDVWGECKCLGFFHKCSTDGGKSWNCDTSVGIGGWGGGTFLAGCQDCMCYDPDDPDPVTPAPVPSHPSPTPPAEPTDCPSFADGPDLWGECKCLDFFQKCSTDGGKSWNCDTSVGPGGWGGSSFLPGCQDCMCYDW